MAENELEKNSKTHKERVIISEFLEWLNSKEIQLAKWEKVGIDSDRLFPLQTRHQDLLNEFFNIDAVKLEKERRALLEGIQKGIK